MIAVGADPQDPQLDSSNASFPITSLGDELPSLSCDIGDLNITSSDIDQLILQSFFSFQTPLENTIQAGSLSSSNSSNNTNVSSSTSTSSTSACDLTSLFFEDTPRPRDLNLSFPGESNASSLFPSVSLNSSCSGPISNELFGDVTPTHSGGVTPPNMSRPSSPTWSESSGSMSTSSVSNAVQDERRPSRGNNPVPRHKRPSHKRAEIKRRDKIKTCLDDIKDHIPSLRDKGKLSESAILTKAAEYVHHLKDGYMERGNKAAELRREIECLSAEIHNFQENLPAAGLKEEERISPSLDDLYQKWIHEGSHQSTRFYIFRSITSKLFETFKEIVGPATNMGALTAKAQEWQTNFLSLPVLRKQILNGMLGLSRQNSIVMSDDKLRLDFGTKTEEDPNNESS